jgi:predicted 2-oxoglutarate/Fe(II)-dependent dioxygenase YbiX
MIKNGFHIGSIDLSDELKKLVKTKNYSKLDQWAKDSLENGILREYLSQFINYQQYEYILALRDAADVEQEDGIWHDDGSRVLAFSLSLNLDHQMIQGGELLIRKKMTEPIVTIPTLHFGGIIVFQTGQNHYEHKITKVNQGQRLVIAGWLN